MIMTRTLISSGSRFEAEFGYSRGVISDGTIYMSGCSGWNYEIDSVDPDAEVQTKQALVNVEAALAKANAKLEHVVKATIYIARRADVDAVLRAWGARMKDIRPAMTLVLAELLDEKMKVEIEVTARV